MRSLSIVVPLFNEEKNISALLKELHELRRGGIFEDEWVFVNDGSTDGTGILLRKLLSGIPRTIVLSCQTNRGKGFAVRQGMLAAHGRFRLLTDADLSVPFSEVRALLPLMDCGAEVIIGSRRLQHSSVIVPQGICRRTMGRGFTKLTNALLGLRASDITCGFKCFSEHAAKEIFREARIDRWAYDAEILFLAKRGNLKVIEVGVPWRNRPESKVRLAFDVFGSLRDLLRIRLLHRHSRHGT